VEGQLRSLYRRLGLRRPDEHSKGGEDVFGLLKDLREAMHHYQVRSERDALLNIDEDNRLHNKRRPMNEDANK